MGNMAEGSGRGTQAEFIVFLGYAPGSLEETQSHLCAAYDRGCLGKQRFAALFRNPVGQGPGCCRRKVMWRRQWASSGWG